MWQMEMLFAAEYIYSNHTFYRLLYNPFAFISATSNVIEFDST